MAQHWKCCVGQLTVGSNPTSSVANLKKPQTVEFGAFLVWKRGDGDWIDHVAVNNQVDIAYGGHCPPARF
jgi:hypothetical protein